MARQRSTEVRLELIVGAFVFIVFLMLGAFTIMLTRENIFRKRYPVIVLFSEISTLREGDNVVVRGMPMGKVKKLDLKSDGVKVTCSLDEDIPIHEDYKVKIVSTSMLGGKALQIDAGTTNTPVLPDDTRLRGGTPTDLIDEASQMVADVRRTLDEGKVLDNVRDSVSSFKEITQKINSGDGLLGRLINDTALADDFKALATQVKEVAGRIERGEGSLGKLLSSDDTLYTNMAATVASLKSISDRLEKGEGTLGRLMSKDDTIYKDLQASVASVKTITERLEKGDGLVGKLLSPDETVYQDLRDAMASLKSTAEKIDKGVGTIGKLVNDDTLYEDVTATIREVRATVADYRETAPVVSFASLLVGAL
jgi:phospholipid/cholesterol/gamma-HCH transport system substrate-binding protein